MNTLMKGRWAAYTFALMALLTLLLSCQARRDRESDSPAGKPAPAPAATAVDTPPAPSPTPDTPRTPESPETPEPEQTAEPEHPPVSGSWTVSLTENRNSGKSYYSGNSVKVDSDGTVTRTRWQNGIAGPQPKSQESKVPPEDLMALRTALAHPRLYQGHASVGSGETVLEITREGKTRTFRTEGSSFVGPPGKVQQALTSIGTGKVEAPSVPSEGP